jgi:hypothetical protein
MSPVYCVSAGPTILRSIVTGLLFVEGDYARGGLSRIVYPMKWLLGYWRWCKNVGSSTLTMRGVDLAA